MFAVDNILTLLAEQEKSPTMEQLNELLFELNANDLAYLMNNLEEEDFLPVSRYVIEHKKDDLPLILTELKSDERNEIIRNVIDSGREGMLREALDEIESDDLSILIKELPEEMRVEVEGSIDKEDLEDAKTQLSYPEDTAGRIMSKDFVAIGGDLNVLEAFSKIKEFHDDAETIYYIYVVDGEEKLQGVISLRDILVYPKESLIRDIMTPKVISVSLDTDQEEVAKLVEHYNLNALPVLSPEGVLMGIVTVDDVIDVIRKEATEDIMKLAGTSSEEYEGSSAFGSFKIRMPWLMVSFLGGMITVRVMGYLTDFVPTVLLLSFVPVIVGMGGNVANQSSTIIVRGLAIGKIRKDELYSVLLRELGTSILLGLFFGVLLFGSAGLTFQDSYLFPVMVSFGIMFSMLIAAVVGSILPILFHSINIDPAVATGPFVTTSIDILGILGYICSIALISLLFGL